MLGSSRPAWNIEALDLAQWKRVRDDVGVEALFRYAELFLDMLADRIETIEWAVGTGAVEQAARTLADLRTSSLMLGAVRLAHVAAAAEAALRQPARNDGSLDLRTLRQEADAVIHALIWALRQLPEPARRPPGDHGPVDE